MKKIILAFVIVLFFSYGAVAPNYNAGLLHINGAVYDASAGSGSILAANSTLLIGGGGTWVLNNAMLTTPRISNSQTEVIEFNSGNYTRNTGYVNGYAAAENQAAGFVMPVGHSVYMPLTIQSALGAGSRLTVAWYDDQPLASALITDPGTGTPVTYTFLPGYYDIRTVNAGVNVVATVPNAAGANTRLTGTVDGVNFVDLGPAATTVALPSGSYQLRFANSSSVLPLTLTAFAATRQGGAGILSWKVGYEQDIQSYTVERSADGRTYTAIGTRSSLGNTAQERTYVLTDAFPAKGTNYYRLKIREQYGKVSYSATRLLNFDGATNLVLYPNPVLDKAIITGIETGMQVSVITLQGQELSRQKASGNTLEITMAHLPAAIYQVRVMEANGKLVGNYQVTKQ